METKNEIATILLLPLIVFIIFWHQENCKKWKESSFKEIKYIIEKEGDEELIDEEALIRAKTELKENTQIEKVRDVILQIQGIKDCKLSLDVEKILIIRITPKTIFAHYKGANAKKNTYIDENLNFIETKKTPKRRNILIIENTDLLEGDELKEYLKSIEKLSKEKDNYSIYKYTIKDKKIISFNVCNNEKKEYII